MTRRFAGRVAQRERKGTLLSGAVIFLALLAGPAGAGPSHDALVAAMESPERASWQKPAEVVSALDIPTGATVVDLGAGTGYFLPFLSRSAGPEGRILALDVDEAMLDVLEERVGREGLANVEVREVAANDPGLAGGSVDLVFVCDAWHHLPERVAYARRLRAGLAAGGRVAIVDFVKDAEIPVGPPPDHRLARDVVVAELRAGGFRLVAEHDFLPHQYFLVFAAEEPYEVEDLTRDVALAIASAPDEPSRLDAVAEVVADFTRRGELPEAATRPLGTLPVTAHFLHAPADGSFSIAALVILPGATTPLHDHGTWTVWGTLRGRDRETRYVRGELGEAGRLPSLEEAGARTLPDEGVSRIPSPPADLHVVENLGNSPSISIHVHGADLRSRRRRVYDVTRGTVRDFVQSYENSPPPVSK